MPLIILYCFLPILNSTSTTHSFSLIVLTSWSFLIARNGFENKPKHMASNIVDLPEPLSPITNVVGALSKSISINCWPVDRKFLYLTFLNTIIFYSNIHQQTLSIV